MKYTIDSLLDLKERVSSLIQAEARAEEKTKARHCLPPGSSRANITTANARMRSTCEDRDRKAEHLESLIKLMMP